MSNIGLLTLEKAKSQMGLGEVGGNNKGPNVKRYARGLEDVYWCAYFVSWCMEEAYADKVKPGSDWTDLTSELKNKAPFKRSGGAKKVAGYALIPVNKFEKVKTPKPGYLVCWHRGAKGSSSGHVGIVSRVDLDKGLFWSIEGNHGAFPSEVDEFKHSLGEANLLGFAIIPDNDLTKEKEPEPVVVPSNQDEKPTDRETLINRIMNLIYEFLNGILPGRKDG